MRYEFICDFEDDPDLHLYVQWSDSEGCWDYTFYLGDDVEDGEEIDGGQYGDDSSCDWEPERVADEILEFTGDDMARQLDEDIDLMNYTIGDEEE